MKAEFEIIFPAILYGMTFICPHENWITVQSFYKLIYPLNNISIPGQVLTNTKNTVLDASLLNTHQFKVWIKSKWNNPRTGVA